MDYGHKFSADIYVIKLHLHIYNKNLTYLIFLSVLYTGCPEIRAHLAEGVFHNNKYTQYKQYKEVSDVTTN